MPQSQLGESIAFNRHIRDIVFGSISCLSQFQEGKEIFWEKYLVGRSYRQVEGIKSVESKKAERQNRDFKIRFDLVHIFQFLLEFIEIYVGMKKCIQFIRLG